MIAENWACSMDLPTAPDDGVAYRIRKVAPTKRAGAVLANVTVEVDGFWIRFRVVRTDKGLAVCDPGNAFKSNGRTRYRSCAGVFDRHLRERLRADVLAAYKAHLRAQGRSVPQDVVPKGRERENRVSAALETVAATRDAAEGARLLDAVLGEVLKDPAATVAERLSVCELLVKLAELDVKRFDAITRAATFELRALSRTRQ
jgi:hypothetical protein